MATEAVRRGAAIDILNEKLERAKESLHDVDENIRKYTGREFGERSRPTDQRKISVGMGGPGLRSRGGARPGPMGTSRLAISAFERLGAPLAKRPNRGSAFSRLGNRVDTGPRIGVGRRRREDDEDLEEDLPHKPVLSSSVVAPSSVTRTRKDSIEEQNQDTKGTARNRRMFGLLLGTLQKFKADAGQKTDKDIQREEIEHKLDVRAKKEKQEIASERRELFTERRNKQKELEKLENLMEIAKEQDVWDRHSLMLGEFIQTKAKPPLFYRPRKMLQENNKKLEETKKMLAEMASKRREAIEEEIRTFEGFDKQQNEGKSEKENEKRDEDLEKETGEKKKRRDSEKGKDEDMDKGRERRKERELRREKDSSKNGERGKEKDRGKDEERGKDRDRDRGRDRDRSTDRDRGRGRDRSKDGEHGRDRDRSKDGERKRERDRSKDGERSKKRNRSKEIENRRERHTSKNDDKDESDVKDEKKERNEEVTQDKSVDEEAMKVDGDDKVNEKEDPYTIGNGISVADEKIDVSSTSKENAPENSDNKTEEIVNQLKDKQIGGNRTDIVDENASEPAPPGVDL